MAYSRWSNSRWYTYWSTSSSKRKDDQIFSVCTIKGFSYKELKENLFGCLFYCSVKDSEGSLTKVSKEELNELEQYMLQFMKNVEEDKMLED